MTLPCCMDLRVGNLTLLRCGAGHRRCVLGLRLGQSGLGRRDILVGLVKRLL